MVRSGVPSSPSSGSWAGCLGVKVRALALEVLDPGSPRGHWKEHAVPVPLRNVPWEKGTRPVRRLYGAEVPRTAVGGAKGLGS